MQSETAVFQNEDGTPHLTYYDKPNTLSFVWDGISDHIQVCHGGYGEPVTDTFTVPVSLATAPSVTSVLDEFQLACLRYVALFERRENLLQDPEGYVECGEDFMAGTICSLHKGHIGPHAPICPACAQDWYADGHLPRCSHYYNEEDL